MESLQTAFWAIIIGLFLKCGDAGPTHLSCDVSSTGNSCTAFLYYVAPNPESADQVAASFSVLPGGVSKIVEGDNAYLVNVTCRCDPDSSAFSAKTRYTVKKNDSWYSISTAFDGLVDMETEITLIPQQTLFLNLMCDCLGYVQVMTYRVQRGDTLFGLALRFGGSSSQIARVNNIKDPDSIGTGTILYIPLANPQNIIVHEDTGPTSGRKSRHRSQTGLIVGVATGVVLLVAAMILGGFYMRAKAKKHGKKKSEGMDGVCELGSSKNWKKVSRFSFWSLPCASLQHLRIAINKANDDAPLPKDSKSFSVSAFDFDKPVVFTYNEIIAATDNFSESKKIGQGSFGSVYLGNLRDKEVAIKQMRDTKSKEFLAELKILCRVHHTNLVELIGYSAGGEHLFLVYEFAENGALSDHLHDPINKGYQPLSWTARVQIALDAAKGLEYIHDHTKPPYVHRDVKTSNILLDADFRAKIADFGLVKLLEHSPEGGRTPTTRVVGTFGYLAPEYVRDGHVGTKSDVYAFGVVLMELITGQKALCRGTNDQNKNAAEWRSLISLMLSILNDEDRANKLKNFVDCDLIRYPEDIIMQMALLSKSCVQDNPNLRPDMRNIVFTLSQMLLFSIEWEAAEASTSQIFSGLYQGR